MVWYELAIVCYYVEDILLGLKAIDRCLEYPEWQPFAYQCLWYYVKPGICRSPMDNKERTIATIEEKEKEKSNEKENEKANENDQKKENNNNNNPIALVKNDEIHSIVQVLMVSKENSSNNEKENFCVVYKPNANGWKISFGFKNVPSILTYPSFDLENDDIRVYLTTDTVIHFIVYKKVSLPNSLAISSNLILIH